MVTREQALTADHYHLNGCKKIVGPKGGEKFECVRARRNGNTKTWKRAPSRFEVPIKHGMRTYGYINNDNAHLWHVNRDCPVEELRDW